MVLEVMVGKLENFSSILYDVISSSGFRIFVLVLSLLFVLFAYAYQGIKLREKRESRLTEKFDKVTSKLSPFEIPDVPEETENPYGVKLKSVDMSKTVTSKEIAISVFNNKNENSPHEEDPSRFSVSSIQNATTSNQTDISRGRNTASFTPDACEAT